MTASRTYSLYPLFGASGFAALVYEVLWTRYLTLILGASMLSVTLVVGCFMGGLALGNYWFGRLADRTATPLRLYARLEFAVGAMALALPAIFAGSGIILVRLAPSFAYPDLLRIGLAAFLLLPATVCMGGTLPLMCRVVADSRADRAFGRLYAINTAGAVLGCFGAGFLLIPWLGHQQTGYVAVAINLFVAVIAYVLSRHEAAAASAPAQVAAAIEERPGFDLLLLVALFVIGMASLGFELLWTRLFVLFLGNTTYAFSSILGVFLAGLSVGGWLYARQLAKYAGGARLFICLAALLGGLVLVTALFYDRLSYLFLSAQLAAGESWSVLILLRLVVAMAIILPPAILSGALLPAGLALLCPAPAVQGRSVGMVLLVNTLGAVAGNVLVALVLIPTIGLLPSFSLLSFSVLAVAAALHLRSAGKFRMYPAFGVAAAALAFITMQPHWNPVLLNSGVYLYSQIKEGKGGLSADLADRVPLFSREGLESTVAVFRHVQGERFFTVNGKVDGGTRDMATQVLLGQLPLLTHPAPRSVLVVGLGTGVTLAEVLTHDVARADVVEIAPEMIDVAAYFSDVNRNALQSAPVRLHIQDARNFLLLNDRKYDVIVSEPSNPWQVGNGNLFTREFYRLVASRLNPGGIFCQWYPLYDLPPDFLQVASATILDTFPNALVFASPSDLIILASAKESPLKIDYRRLLEKFEGTAAKESLAQLGAPSAPDLLASFFFSGATPLAKIASGSRINTDDRALFEHAKPSQGRYLDANRALLSRAQTGSFLLDQPIVNFGASGDAAYDERLRLSVAFAAAGRPVDARAVQAKP